MAGSSVLPALFLAHGSPMLALEGGAWGEAVSTLGHELPALRAILVCSAHWESAGPFLLSSAETPGVMHDFGGFPEVLYTLDYPAPGSPGLAAEAAGLLRAAGLEAALDAQRPLDHGAWVPLRYLAPRAEVPVLQLSLPRPRTPELLLAAGRALAPLREQGVLIVGSGGVVHNLRRLDWSDATGPQPWARDFQAWVDQRLAAGDAAGLADWRKAPGAAESVPTSEHLDPLFVALGAAQVVPEPLFEGWQLGSLSLASYRFA
ncbi:DODA-type extradiol aromatic ring-opening family dioxygenase [Geothrix fermentans]|uniref:DODA-type extradiol aromatic ring-opening family dioxygenase n=1 Tax=Geothrix fermentans TaxID=44676 RepID=UPI000421F563|nr:class III extradiol ring-cleavage dioxygenase [Geothrix fermentans]